MTPMPYARTDDRVRIYYEEHGAGTPLVLAYGIGGNVKMWDVNLPGLARRHRLPEDEPVAPRALGQPRGPREVLVPALGARPQGRARPSGASPGARRRAVARCRDRDPLRAGVSRTRPLARRHQLLVGQRAAALLAERRDARAFDRDHADPGHGRHGRVRDGREPERLRAPRARPRRQGGVLRGVPAALTPRG